EVARRADRIVRLVDGRIAGDEMADEVDAAAAATWNGRP
ncbi:MAG: ABC transporter ATP-binding protein, partial [Pyrinomonadaceae bacterium]|nr:ABC transporter ATP-binding protein [Phycisphaerales bacterium]